MANFTSQPRQPCEVNASCGAFRICNKESAVFCNCLTGFTPRSDTEWLLNDHSGVAGAEECHSTCLSSCSCNAYAYDNGVGSIWNELLNLKQFSPEDGSGSVIYTRLDASDKALGEDAKSGKFPLKLKVIISGVVAIAVLLLCSFSYIYYRRKMAKRIANKQSTEGHPVPQWFNREREAQNLMDENDKQDIAVPFFCLEDILSATGNFSDVNKLGQGGFGPVYKGIFSGGQEIAVKRLSSQSRQGIDEFRNEVILISKLQHRNLVRLLGYCITGYQQILLYEYMPNKSLDTFLNLYPTRSKSLKWEKRFEIILGISRGLLYLHEDSRLRIIHRDMKTSNILLDQEMNAKISDFGLARIVEEKTTEANTKKVVGTYGYMSPEYALEGVFSIKSDVFSIGVVILEIITGRRNTGFYQSNEASNLLVHAWNFWKEKRALHLLDHSLLESCNPKEAMKCINIGLLCVQEDPGDRPTMSNVVTMLRSESMALPKPNQPAFVSRRNVSNSSSVSSGKPQSYSKVELTITVEEGR
ncbi:G-type lectin S-receptor-like serine/threonine-protein kinase [Capsicum chacoense]